MTAAGEEVVRASSCAVCGSDSSLRVLQLSGVPVFCNVLYGDRDEALGAPQGDVDLVLCQGCGHLENRAFDAESVAYAPSYENSLFFSGTFRQFAGELVQRLASAYDLRGKTVFEIGSGKGDFLAMLCRATNARGIGYDPSYDGEAAAEAEGLDIDFLVSPWNTDQISEAALVCCRHVLEHVAEPRSMVRDLSLQLQERDTALYFEVPDAEYMLRERAFYDVIYEHCGYFTPASLSQLFEDNSFCVTASGASFGGQFLWLDALPASGTVDQLPSALRPGVTEQLRELAMGFADGFQQAVQDWQHRLDELARSGGRAAVWGAGSKGVTFLNVLADTSVVCAVVDLNPRKTGQYVPVTGHEVIAPDALPAYDPDLVIVMNPLYVDEVTTRLRALGSSAAVSVA